MLGTTLVVVLVFLNMIYQYKPMDGRTAFWLAVKIGLIGIFATNWMQFNAFSSAILYGIDSIAGALVASVGGGSPGPSGTFAEEFDRLIAELGAYLNAAGSELNWMAGAMLDIVGVLLLSILGGLAAFILVASRLMIALLIGIAPVMIFDRPLTASERARHGHPWTSESKGIAGRGKVVAMSKKWLPRCARPLRAMSGRVCVRVGCAVCCVVHQHHARGAGEGR